MGHGVPPASCRIEAREAVELVVGPQCYLSVPTPWNSRQRDSQLGLPVSTWIKNIPVTPR